ncbi:MAG: hypothetical protein VR73_01390 [Gammaproteobacteria bacterium BRH_c0]|nr:MAG: hypothetical protein VR73_01390 [Gammaproteobacteria bacterium BRH_c0]
MSDEDDDELDNLDEAEEEETAVEEQVKPSPLADLEARRRLEAKLEERRLRKLIQDYDFDDIA